MAKTGWAADFMFWNLRMHLRKKVLYVMILNLCSMYMMTIFRMYPIMGALLPKLTEQGNVMCWNVHVFAFVRISDKNISM